MSYTLATAAEAAGVTKPTMWRWIKAGKLSATKTETNEFRIDPAELHRYLDSVKATALLETARPEEAQRSDMAPPAAETDPETLQATIALRAEIEKLTALLEMERQRGEEWKAQADRWASQAERLAIAAPVTTPATAGSAEPQRRRGIWPFRNSA